MKHSPKKGVRRSVRRSKRLARALWLAAALAGAIAVPPRLGAHELMHEVTRGTAVVIELSEPDGTLFSHEPYEIHRAGEEMPFQTGRTDAQGRIVFVPDRHATWRVRTFSEDGHGADFTLEAGPGETAGAGGAGAATTAPGRSRLARGPKILVGLSLLFGLFGVISLFARRRS